MEIGKIEQLNGGDSRPEIKVLIRELILAVEEADKFVRADKIAGLICDALGMYESCDGWEDEGDFPHMHNDSCINNKKYYAE